MEIPAVLRAFLSFDTVPRIDCQILAGERPQKREKIAHAPVQNYSSEQ